MSFNQPHAAPVATTHKATWPAALWKTCGLAIVGSWLIALSAQIAVPMVPVPMTMQTAAVLLLPALFGWRVGVAASVLYLLQGALGMPVFANGASGLVRLLGPTGGYLMAFPIAAALVGLLAERPAVRTLFGMVLAMTLGHAVIFLCGVTWLAMAIGWTKAIAVGLTPFLFGSIVKSGLAAACVELYRSKR